MHLKRDHNAPEVFKASKPVAFGLACVLPVVLAILLFVGFMLYLRFVVR